MCVYIVLANILFSLGQKQICENFRYRSNNLALFYLLPDVSLALSLVTETFSEVQIYEHETDVTNFLGLVEI